MTLAWATVKFVGLKKGSPRRLDFERSELGRRPRWAMNKPISTRADERMIVMIDEGSIQVDGEGDLELIVGIAAPEQVATIAVTESPGAQTEIVVRDFTNQQTGAKATPHDLSPWRVPLTV